MPAPSSDIVNAWRAGHRVPDVTFALDDLVILLGGEHTGNVGSVVSLDQVQPEVVYSVEIDTNFVVPARQSEIELAD